jgi:hypothetical protein
LKTDDVAAEYSLKNLKETDAQMIHYTCDRCRKVIETEHETRYVIRIEIQASDHDGHFGEDGERGHLMAIEDIIDQLDDEEGGEELSPEIFSRRAYDLCSKCYAAYLQNPLAIEPQPHLGFSNN